ncbi:PHP domain-containing protein [Leucobacter coleopterorum]|uniref:PHP domain-containing protein n=1 Tax=Leucobacter coleopterorum TaxID=2714933 RepID=A0ABX6JYM0_9MICO|nr:PHP domain-containing protein [Leucobacter coleopterorum]QIM19420.1 PHP domain-containing protein [Leucobacter coleopterorum]
MTAALLRGDHHVHSTFSDDATSTLEENVVAAVRAGLDTVRLVDHVRGSTTWVPEYLAAVRALPVPDGLSILTGVETKVLDVSGALDLPALPAGIDRILIADHQFPSGEGPLSPSTVVERLATGWSTEDALDELVTSLVQAMRRYPGNQLAHCFSILPKVGLSESQLGSERLAVWAETAAATDTHVEINEKWGCPLPATLAALRRSGATLVASTDSHKAEDVGRYRRVPEILGSVSIHG